MSRFGEAAERLAAAVRWRAARGQPPVSVQMLPAMTPDDDLAMHGLERVAREYTGLPKHAAIRAVALAAGQSAAVELLVLKPCKRGLPRARVTFRGGSLAEAARDAKRFIEAILPCDEESE